jgi:hypothetical protein
MTACAGCGGPDGVRASNGIVNLTIEDFRLHPQIVRAGPGMITFSVRNTGRLPHNFRLRGIGGTRMKLPTLLPGESAFRTIPLGRGDWRMFCSLANHEELGLYGTLVIR